MSHDPGSRILALETTGTAGSAAIFHQGNLIAQQELDADQRTAQSLAPAIRDLLQDAGWKPADLDLVAVTTGPGSFTGLRVGVTTAKVFAYAAGARCLSVDSLEALALQIPDEFLASERIVVPVLNAYRGEVFSAAFRVAAGQPLQRVSPTAILTMDEWLTSLPQDAVLLGPILEKLADRLPPSVQVVPAECWTLTAASVGKLAVRMASQGLDQDPMTLLPKYLRRSAAEEKWDLQHGT